MDLFCLGTDSDQDFDPSADMMVNDFDDEHTLDEEEALADDELTTKDEIDELTKVCLFVFIRFVLRLLFIQQTIRNKICLLKSY